MDMENVNTLIETTMKACGKTIRGMDLERWSMLMEISMKANGQMM